MNRRLICLVLILGLLFGLAAAGRADYTYTVRFYAGRQGSFDGEDMVVYENLRYGDRVTFRMRMVTLHDDSKYYIKGIRESGKDNNTVGATSFLVTKDQDYTVAYGILGDAVSYTINYLDLSGNPLAPSETYYGNVGDKPVVAYLYIEGYTPQYYNLTRTLTPNAAENVFDFIYRPVEAGVVGDQEFTINVIDESGAGFVINAGAAGENQTGGEQSGGESGSNEQGGSNPGGTEQQPAEPPFTESEEIGDLDLPLSGNEVTQSGEEEQQPRVLPWYAGTPAKIGGSAAAILLAGGLWWFLIGEKKKRKETENEE